MVAMKLIAACVLLTSQLAIAQGAPSASPPVTVKVPHDTRISVMLTKDLDAAKAKPDDPVKLEAMASVKGPDGKVLIPEGAKLLGRVTHVQVWSKQQPESQLSIVVESAAWKKHAATLRAFVSGGLRIMAQGVEIVVVSTTGERPPAAILAQAGITGPEASDPRAQALEGIELKTAPNANLGSLLVSKKRNVRIPSGTLFDIRHFDPPSP